MNRRDFLLAASAAAGGSAAASGTAAAQQGNGSGGGGGNASGGGGGNASGGGGNASGGGGNQSAGGAGGGGGGGPTKTVKVGPGGALTFEPAELSLPTGGKVKFVWESSGHNVSPSSGNWGHQPIEDKGFSYTTPPFQQSGAQEYVCTPHESAGMVGTIQVGSSGGGGGEEEEPSPEEMGVPFQAHFVGIATLLMMVLSLVYTFFLVKYGESPNAKGGD
ncbi:plastocyanin/azurin family copper-binding protein [Halococcus sediminicola]|uniref:plastocyanin/azurin family copper-binding protein n=1 Tax=Halococcus sediminicola TaxID=1264579 RepID=UPI0006787792|nr:plastocyanin/azurin family copper-binding protein [Halococcus sediminicola]